MCAQGEVQDCGAVHTVALRQGMCAGLDSLHLPRQLVSMVHAGAALDTAACMRACVGVRTHAVCLAVSWFFLHLLVNS